MSKTIAFHQQHVWKQEQSLYLARQRSPAELRALMAIAKTPSQRRRVRLAQQLQEEFHCYNPTENEVTPRACAWPRQQRETVA